MDDARPSPVPGATRPRVPTAWFVGLAAVLLLSALARELAAPLILGGLYLIVTAAWALVRRRWSRSVLGRRGLSGVLATGLVLLLAGGAVAGPPEREAVAGATVEPATEEPTTEAPAGADVPAASALATALELEVKGRAPRTGYDRDLFGSGWVDTDRNGCDTRNDILARDLTGISHRPGTRDSIVEAGMLQDPYSGHRIDFVRGNDTSNAVQIDHVVALSDAWQKGAQQWDTETRVRFGNDPLNLLAVDGPLNMHKGDGDTATWLPPNRSYRCPYVARQVAVKDVYGLWVTQAEQDAMVRVLGDCPEEPLPAGAGDRPVASAPEPAPGPPARPAAPVPAEGVHYRNCAAARAAGAAPVHSGDPGYGAHLDRDGDGVGCE